MPPVKSGTARALKGSEGSWKRRSPASAGNTPGPLASLRQDRKNAWPNSATTTLVRAQPRMETTRIVDGTLYARSARPYAYDLRVHDLGHGHVEATALPRYGWHEVDHLSPLARADYAVALTEAPQLTPQELLDRAAANRERSTRRARTKVRRLAKAKGLTVLLTLTYRENMVDRERMARDFDAFVKRVRRAIPGFEYVCVFERQKRGAWHAHIAVPRILSHYAHRGTMVKSYDLLRSMWRGIVGADNGNVDVSRNKRVNRSSAKLAAYLSKYIGKTFDQAERHVNSYSASGRDLPAAVIERVITGCQVEALNRLVDLLSMELGGACQFHQAWIDGGGVYVCLSPPDGS